jgi:metal-sulfur cluster biosynthetic enzyme
MTLVAQRQAQLWEALADVQDPELPISIVDMGLVVDVRLQGRTASVQITFTSMGCPGVDMILDDVRARLLLEPDIEAVEIEIVWDPIWSKDRLSEEGKMALREWGISL